MSNDRAAARHAGRAKRQRQERLERIVNFDPLTNLPNRLLLSDRQGQALEQAQAHRNKQSIAVAYLDLDGFKEINDQHGHDVGDQLLIAIAKRMQSSLRDMDTLARMGGDEFVAVLTDIGEVEDFRQMLKRILKACSEPACIDGVVVQVTASISVTLYPQDESDVDQLMRHADQAMYEAKQSGKNCFHLFDAARDAELKSRAEKLGRIAQGLLAEEFVLYFQPKVNMRMGELIGLEALVRWQHPELGLLALAVFLPLIENHQLIETLGDWVIDAALRQIGAWKRSGFHVKISVNIAARQFQAKDFATQLAARVALQADVCASDLGLELLETSALEDIDAVAETMRTCRRLGFIFSVDDFGTGYSSLTYLKRLPAETLKIDQSFVRDMLEDHEDLAIVKGVIGLAAAFNRQVIAQSVETVAHGKQLLALGCHLAQGYGIARPMPAADVMAWASSRRVPDEWLTEEVKAGQAQAT
jgi:diguanylate cyclase (GGDEF)-like protein